MEPVNSVRWAGVDWGDASHAVHVVDELGKEIDKFKTLHTAEGLIELIGKMRCAGPITGVAVETSRGLMVQKLLEAGFTVYPVNPKISHAWRECWKVNAPKSDPTDAWVLAEGLRQNHARLRPFKPDEDRMRELKMLCADECALIAQRTGLVNQLQAALKAYYPQALEWFDNWTGPTPWNFVLAFPTPETLQKASRKKLFSFLRAHHIGIRPIWEERFEKISRGAAWPSDPATTAAKSVLAVTLAKQLRTLQAGLDEYRERIEKLYDDHPDSSIFNSLPGAGPKLAARLLCHFGADRSRFDDADGVAKLGGAAPVTVASGKSKIVKMRRLCQKPFRQTLHQWAFLTTTRCEWARAFYHRARQKGNGHALALRKLAGKWIDILYRMWVDRKPYDEAHYLTALIRHGSPLVKEIGNLQPLTSGE